MSNTYERGNFTINDQFIHFFGTTLNLANIDHMDFFNYNRHSYFYGLKTWFFGLIIIVIIEALSKNLTWLATLYLLSIIVLIAYNIRKHRIIYHGLKIETSAGKTIYLKSENRAFLDNVHDAIIEAMNSKKANYTINFDSHDVINNGIINKGNKNKNKVKVTKND